jgi:hypothetical protein
MLLVLATLPIQRPAALAKTRARDPRRNGALAAINCPVRALRLAVVTSHHQGAGRGCAGSRPPNRRGKHVLLRSLPLRCFDGGPRARRPRSHGRHGWRRQSRKRTLRGGSAELAPMMESV